LYVIKDAAVVDDLETSHKVETRISKWHVGNAGLKQRERAGSMAEGVALKIEPEWRAVVGEPCQVAAGATPSIKNAARLGGSGQLAEPRIGDGAHAGVPPVVVFDVRKNFVFAGFHAERSFGVRQMRGASSQWY